MFILGISLVLIALLQYWGKGGNAKVVAGEIFKGNNEDFVFATLMILTWSLFVSFAQQTWMPFRKRNSHIFTLSNGFTIISSVIVVAVFDFSALAILTVLLAVGLTFWNSLTAKHDWEDYIKNRRNYKSEEVIIEDKIQV